MKSDTPYLAHILDSISAIEAYIQGGRNVFLRERLVRDAVIRNLEVIGEAASRLSPALKKAGDTPWSKVIAFRNRLIHGYWSVDPLLVWDVVEKSLPKLKSQVVRLLAEADIHD